MNIQNIRDSDGLQGYFQASTTFWVTNMAADEPKTIPVPEAGARYFGLSRNGSYDAAKRGEIPVIRIGSRLRVPVQALERMLQEAGGVNGADDGPDHRGARAW